MLRILHLHHTPGVQAAPHLLPLGLNLLVRAHHCKRDACLKKRGRLTQLLTTNKRLDSLEECDSLKEKNNNKGNLQDSSLLFEVFILIRLGIRKVVNLDSVLIDLIKNLGEKNANKGKKSVVLMCFGKF